MLGANAFKNGHDTKLIDIAVEAVKGNAGADNKPVTKTVNGVTTVTYFDDDQKRISTRTPP